MPSKTHKCIAFESANSIKQCKNEAEHPNKQDVKQYKIEGGMEMRYCEAHWQNLVNCGAFPCIYTKFENEKHSKVVGCPYTSGNQIIEGQCDYEILSGKLKKSDRGKNNLKYKDLAMVSPVSSPRLVSSKAVTPRASTPRSVSPKPPSPRPKPASPRTKLPALKPMGSFEEETRVKEAKMKREKDEESESDTDDFEDAKSEASESDIEASESEMSESDDGGDEFIVPKREKRKHTSLRSLPSKTRKRMPRVFPVEMRESEIPGFFLRKPARNFVKTLNLIDSSQNLEDVKSAVKLIVDEIRYYHTNTKLSDKNKKPYSFNVEENVVTEFSKIMARYMFNPLRVELLMSYMFDYESRDLTLTFSYFGFRGLGSSETLQSQLSNTDSRFARPQPVFAYTFNETSSLTKLKLPAYGATMEDNINRAEKMIKIASESYGLNTNNKNFLNLKNQVENFKSGKTTTPNLKDLVENATLLYKNIIDIRDGKATPPPSTGTTTSGTTPPPSAAAGGSNIDKVKGFNDILKTFIENHLDKLNDGNLKNIATTINNENTKKKLDYISGLINSGENDNNIITKLTNFTNNSNFPADLTGSTASSTVAPKPTDGAAVSTSKAVKVEVIENALSKLKNRSEINGGIAFYPGGNPQRIAGLIADFDSADADTKKSIKDLLEKISKLSKYAGDLTDKGKQDQIKGAFSTSVKNDKSAAEILTALTEAVSKIDKPEGGKLDINSIPGGGGGGKRGSRKGKP